MAEFAPCSSLTDLANLDEADIIAGYFAGYHGSPEPLASVFSRAFLHGWRNGAVDSGRMPKDSHQSALAHAFHIAQALSDQVVPIGRDFDDEAFPFTLPVH